MEENANTALLTLHPSQGPLPSHPGVLSIGGLHAGALREGTTKLFPILAPSFQALSLLPELRESLPNELICLSGSGDKSKEEN